MGSVDVGMSAYMAIPKGQAPGDVPMVAHMCHLVD